MDGLVVGANDKICLYEPWPSHSWLARADSLIVALVVETSLGIATAKQARSSDRWPISWSWMVPSQANLSGKWGRLGFQKPTSHFGPSRFPRHWRHRPPAPVSRKSCSLNWQRDAHLRFNFSSPLSIFPQSLEDVGVLENVEIDQICH